VTRQEILPGVHEFVFDRIHISSGWAFIVGAEIRRFSDMEALLVELECVVTEMEPEISRSGEIQVAHRMFRVAFPAYTKIIQYPRDLDSNRTASGNRRRGAKRPDPTFWSPTHKRGRILIPGISEDYVVTYYARTEYTPMLFDRGVHEVEK
jgi:hypothetical protein